MLIKKRYINPKRYSIKSPYTMTPEFYIVHNTYNDAKASSEAKYMEDNNNKTSFHVAIDDIEVLELIPEDRNSFSAGDGGKGRGNRKGIGIEICYSKSGGVKFDKAEINASKYIAQRLKARGWGIDRVKKHQDFSGKYCPHRTLDRGWNRFLKMIEKEMKGVSVMEWLGINSPFNTKEKVRQLQFDLVELGYDVGSYGRNGVMGKDTDKAIRSLQKDNSLVVDGEVGLATSTLIQTLLINKRKPVKSDLEVKVKELETKIADVIKLLEE